ncbi:SDR family oxidoreductase [Mesorhizobium sp.]|uniref:SDR family NAD(P)-dependent oxidoreductase n=1 Tax=Mesorhizobium sp. TaxID=1871066 RepID=UPI000FE7ABCD|nr:SDR family oxidoreductase [Mesorhizobium sp.]RWB66295.1 MAG: SDR family oxidoreductase [Mesorhizobium sp.]
MTVKEAVRQAEGATKLAGKIAVISGAAQGIGEAIAREFVAEGARVVIADIQERKGQALAVELGGNDVCRYVSCDVSQSADVNKVIDCAERSFGGVDIVVNNSGINHNATILEISEQDFDRVIATNLKGAFLLGQAGARAMLKRGGGSIINMSSINAIVCSPHIVPYAVSKGGINQLTSVMALGLADHNIRVNGVGPGSIETDLLRSTIMLDAAAYKGVLARTPMKRLGQPREIARICVFLASDDASYITGETIYADGGRLRLAYTVPIDH